MLVCMKCHMEYEEGTPFCSNCGGDLVTKEEPKPVRRDKKKGAEVKPDGKLVCPKCHILYEKLTSCIRCGTPLVTQSALKEMKESPPPLAPETKVTESKAASPLDVTKEPSSVPPPRKTPLEPKRERQTIPYAAELEQEPSSIQATEKRPAKELPEDQREKMAYLERSKRNILKSRLGGLFFIFLVMAMAALYFFLNPFSGQRIGQETRSSEKATGSQEEQNSTLSKEAAPTIPSMAIPVVLLPQEIEGMKGLLENIRQANLKKNINLLMSCYASDYNDPEERRRTALESWSKYNYLDLIYTLKVKSVTTDLVKVQVGWKIQLIPMTGGQTVEGESVLDATLKKEKNEWKIKEVTPAK